MKKIFALAIIALSTLVASAEGTYIGGNVGYWHSGANNTNHLTILPEFGYNFSKTWAIGTTVGYDYIHFCGEKTSGHMFQVAPYARFSYFRSSNDLVQLFVDGGVGFGAGWTSYEDEDSKTACIWNVGLRPGIAINLSEKFSFVTHIGFLGYKGANNAAKSVGYYNEGGLKLDTNDLTIGFYYNF